MNLIGYNNGGGEEERQRRHQQGLGAWLLFRLLHFESYFSYLPAFTCFDLCHWASNITASSFKNRG